MRRSQQTDKARPTAARRAPVPSSPVPSDRVARDAFPLFRFLAALAFLAIPLLASCRTVTADLDRVGPPLRFADLRETSRWTPGFDPSWWTAIDRAYEAYDAEVARIAQGSWDALLLELSDAEQTGFPTERHEARGFWERHLRVRRELESAERSFLDAIDEELPEGADVFIGLVRARAAFWRASAVWAPHGDRMPGPLEVLILTGEPIADPEISRAATDAYLRLAASAARAADERFDAYLAYCDGFGSVNAELSAARAARERLDGDVAPDEVAAADARLAAARGAMQALEQQLRERDRRAADEKLRVVILRENRAVASAIASPERRSDALERIDAFLHLGVRSLPSVRALRDLSRRIVARSHPDDAERLERLARIDAAFDAYVQAAAPLRVALASTSASERERAFSALVALVGPLMRAFREATGTEVAALELAAIGVSTGRSGVEEAAETLLARVDSAGDAAESPVESPVEFLAEEVDGTLAESRQAQRFICGTALSPRAFAALAGELRLDGDRARELASLREEEVARLVERTRGIVDRFETASRETAEDRSLQPAERARRLVRDARAASAEIQAFDRASNERVLGEAARLAGVAPDDARVERARLELALASTIGAIDAREIQSIGGITRAAATNPLEILRRMDVDDAAREAALALVLGHADALREAHREAAAGVLRNIEGFARMLMEREGAEDFPEEAWRARDVGSRAVAAREAIGVELGVVLGDRAEAAYLAAWRRLVDPEMDPPRHAALAPLAALAAGARLDPAAARASLEARAVLSEFLAEADESRDRALRALAAWYARQIRAAGLDGSAGWKGVAGRSAIGWVLRARAIDADVRALARCEALLSGMPELAEGLEIVRRTSAPLPVRLLPYFPKDR